MCLRLCLRRVRMRPARSATRRHSSIGASSRGRVGLHATRGAMVGHAPDGPVGHDIAAPVRAAWPWK